MSSTKKRVDLVASQIYQQGDGGLGALASVLTGGPDSFLQRLDQVQLNRTAANRAVHEAEQARTAAALAEVQDASITSRITQARADEIGAMSSLKVLLSQLALVDKQISVIDVSAPQRAVGPDGCPSADEIGRFLRLPPREREALIQAWSEGLPPAHAAMIQRYYRELARTAPGKETP